MLSILVLAFSASVLGFVETTYTCSPTVSSYTNVHVFGPRCYQFVVYEHRRFQDAQAFCNGNGGDLATVYSEDINNFIKETLKTNYQMSGTPAWIGLRYFNRQRLYRWMDGSSFEGDHIIDNYWGYHEDQCFVIVPDAELWEAKPCGSDVIGFFDTGYSYHNFVCEYPATPVITDPTTTRTTPSTSTTPTTTTQTTTTVLTTNTPTTTITPSTTISSATTTASATSPSKTKATPETTSKPRRTTGSTPVPPARTTTCPPVLL